MTKKRVGLILAAVAFGSLVWLSVSMQEQYTVSVTAPFTVTDIPQGWAIRTAVPSSVQLRFRGEGWRLAGLLLGATPSFNVAYLPTSSGVQVITSRDAVDRIAVRTGIQFLGMVPDSVIIGTDRRSTKVVPAVPDLSLSFREGYGQVGAVMVTPESITVEGARSVIAGIKSWRTERSVFSDVKAPIDAQVPLARGRTAPLSLSTESIHLTINVQPFAEKTLTGIPVEVDSVPMPREVILIPPRVELVVRGGIKQLSSVTSSDFRIAVDYQAIETDTTGSVAYSITGPEEIQIVRRKPDRLQHIVRKRL
jgi:YbbR domain-containing protein